MNALQRKEWLADRQTGIGATDIAAICGVGFRTAADVYAEKIGEPEDRAPLPIMLLGLALEPHNADIYSRRFLGEDDALLEPGFVRSRSADWMFATFDRIASHRRPGETDSYRDVELKYVRFFSDAWGEDGSDLVPDAYSLQATWQQTVMLSAFSSRKIDAPHIAALDSSGEQRVFPVVYSERLASLLMEIAEDFWGRVQRREAVGPEWVHPLAERARAEAAVIRTDSTITLGEEALTLAETMKAAAAERDKADEIYRRCKEGLRLALGEHECGRLPDGRIVKQYAVAEKLITPRPYLREARVDLRVLKGAKS